jgi:nicotinamidase-related amidase
VSAFIDVLVGVGGAGVAQVDMFGKACAPAIAPAHRLLGHGLRSLGLRMTTTPSPRHRSQRAGLIERDATHDVALVVLDMISCWSFPDAPALLEEASRVAPAIARLKQRCLAAGVPVIYANDNSGQWRSDFKFVVDESMEGGGAGAEVTRRLQPGPEDYFVLKPKHSAFFATPLEILLDHLRTRQLIVVGVAGDQCVLNTAADARMRDFDVVVPADCIASLTPARNRRAIDHLGDVLDVKTTPARSVRLHARARHAR